MSTFSFSTLAQLCPISYRKLSIFQIMCYWPNCRHSNDQLEMSKPLRESRKRSNPLKCHFNCLLWKIVLTAKVRTHIQIEFGVYTTRCQYMSENKAKRQHRITRNTTRTNERTPFFHLSSFRVVVSFLFLLNVSAIQQLSHIVV